MYAYTNSSVLNIPGLKRASGDDNCHDARLRNFATGERKNLDVQPYVEFGCPDTDIYTDEYKMKPRKYNNYNDIDLGLILYQTDETAFDPYFGPTLGLLGKSKCHYFKSPNETQWRISERTPKFCKYNYLNCNPATIDTQYHREDIISKYGDQINRNRFMVY
jgi:hypothetical protein